MTLEEHQMRRDWPPPAALEVQTLGTCRCSAPPRKHEHLFVDETDRVLLCSSIGEARPFLEHSQPLPSFEPAGARARLFFDPANLTAAVLTCGGLCPGLNNVVRAIVLQLTYAYGVRRILGLRYGYAGLSKAREEPLSLSADVVESLHEDGGTLLGSSRGPQDVGEMVDTLQALGIGLLFVIGGDGGLRGASALAAEIGRRQLEIGVIGVPKTIDNDLDWIWRSFGFDTAVGAARAAIAAAHDEARGVRDGIGMVKLMGRHSGFIAAHATLACSDVNFCLVPEVPFSLQGEGGFLQCLERRLSRKHHAVVVVAEGAGQELVPGSGTAQADKSGNLVLKDIGSHLRQEIKRYFDARAAEAPIRYIDPSYMIRSLPASSFDAQLCLSLGQHAVHAGMAGKTDMLVGSWNQRFTHVPIPLAVAKRKRIDPRSEIWKRVLETTGQPASMLAAPRA
jgi:6-phosphofructokinase 1